MTDDEIKEQTAELDKAKENIRLGEIERRGYQEQIEKLTADITVAEKERDEAIAERQSLATLVSRASATETALKASAETWKRKAEAQERLHLQAVERCKSLREGREAIAVKP